ncbi:periplasmic nitrate reductase chaperone NapD [Anaerospora hongkongensis]|uniref:Periplasmic nitrate reductase chaperone NapD n=1 Tax=Anaerospora hongkongensis TaxID=244830 RepID=A0A4R1Q6B3_9FIRM|nr:chaperone NapD [Anaerospora hongkongensis]TCL37364.1 periplasmic nitrate reductase chaperone NapD [Anaerospora hongkongensis]
MAIASMIIQPAANATERVATELSGLCGVTVNSITSKQEIIIVVEAASLNAVSEVAHAVEAISGVLGVFPSYITVADETAD